MDEQKVIGFLDRAKDAREQEAQKKAFRNTSEYKLKMLDREEDKANGVCLDAIFSSIYKNALPLNDDYKVAHGEDLDAEMRDFINCRCPKGMEYYVKEGIKKGSRPAAKIMESAQKLVREFYEEKALNIAEIPAEDLVFQTGDDLQQKIDVVNQDLGIDDVAQVIRDNVKSSAISEITRAKKEKEDLRQLEHDMIDDMKIKSEAAIDERLERAGYTKNVYTPTLFQGMMIGSLNKLQAMEAAGTLETVNLYDALEEYGIVKEDGEASTLEERAFVEAVKEYTKFSIIRALNLESFGKRDISDLAVDYATMK